MSPQSYSNITQSSGLIGVQGRLKPWHIGACVGWVMFSLLSGCDTTKPEEQPAYRKAVAVEERVVKVENQADALVKMSADVDRLDTQSRKQTGQLEELKHQLDAEIKARQAISADMNERVQSLEDRVKTLEAKLTGLGQTPAADSGVAPKAAAPSDKDAYQAALNLFKQKDFSGCANAFDQFSQSYPSSTLIDNAVFWSGACRYSDGRLGEAMSALSRLLRDYPDSRKIPDALLVMGKTEMDLKRPKEAREILKRLIKDYPDAAVIAEAKARLKSLEASR
jgi:tol-pal system protein YbgF